MLVSGGILFLGILGACAGSRTPDSALPWRRVPASTTQACTSHESTRSRGSVYDGHPPSEACASLPTQPWGSASRPSSARAELRSVCVSAHGAGQPATSPHRWWSLTPPLPPTDLCLLGFRLGAIGRPFAIHFLPGRPDSFNRARCSSSPELPLRTRRNAATVRSTHDGGPGRTRTYGAPKNVWFTARCNSRYATDPWSPESESNRRFCVTKAVCSR